MPESGRLTNLEWLLENRVQLILGVQLDIVDDRDSSVAGVHAAYNYAEKVVRIRESVMRKIRIDEPEARFTVCHEIGHICLHSNPDFFRQVLPNHLPKKICDPEWQADFFAVDFQVDRELLKQYDDPIKAAHYFQVPIWEMQLYFAQLKAQGVLASGAMTQADKCYEAAIQEGFEF
ncbi:hypothetical protein B0E51_07355 [Rhodanobacter sp. C05]|nr:hypothetical protein B0E51_07355 [Rhodanobacter sp. C05]